MLVAGIGCQIRRFEVFMLNSIRCSYMSNSVCTERMQAVLVHWRASRLLMLAVGVGLFVRYSDLESYSLDHGAL